MRTYAPTTLPLDFVPNEHHIIIGRGRLVKNHVANQKFDRMVDRLSIDMPLRANRLVLVEDRDARDNQGDLTLLERRIRVSDRVLNYLRKGIGGGLPVVDESLASTCKRLLPQERIETLKLPAHTRANLGQLAMDNKFPVVLLGPIGAEKDRVADALAASSGKTLLVADLTAMLTLPLRTLEARLADLTREAMLENDVLYLEAHKLPQHIAGPTAIVLERIKRLKRVILGTDELPLWAVTLTTGWPSVEIGLPDLAYREELWVAAFAHAKKPPTELDLKQIAEGWINKAA